MSLRATRFLAFALLSAASGRLAWGDQVVPRPRIIGLSHVALWVKDLAKSREFYKGYLGFDEPYSLGNADGKTSLAWIKINDRQSVELFPLSGKPPEGGDSLYHLALETDDARAMLAYLISKGVHGPGGKPLAPTVARGRIGNLNFFAEDPDRHTVEFVQYEPSGWTLQNAGRFLPKSRISARMSHVGITVKDLGKSLAFYRDILGLAETWRGSSDGITLSWVTERLPESNDYIELMLLRATPSTDQLHVLHHFCLEVGDAGAAAEALGKRTLPAGCRPSDPIRTGRNRKRQVNCYDPDGTRVEIMDATTVDGQPAPPSGAPAPAAWN